MALDWLSGSGGGDVTELISKRKYKKAIEILEALIQQGGQDSRVRLQLADALTLDGRGHQAVPILMDLADEYASEGQAAKAIAMLKKVQKIEVGNRDVERRLASLIKDKSKSVAKKTGWAPREGVGREGSEASGAVFSASDFEPQPVFTEEQRIAAAKGASWVPSTTMEEPAAWEPIPTSAKSSIPIPPPPPAPPRAAPPPAAAEAVIEILPDEPPAPVDSPLFNGFSQDELVEVIHGLRLLTFEPGDIILTEGDPGTSLFVLTTGVAKAFVKNPQGMGQLCVRRMTEGTFFGEISILSGKPRTATVTAATHCELLELDRATLDGITKTHPRVHQVLEDFYIERASTQDEAIARAQQIRGSGA